MDPNAKISAYNRSAMGHRSTSAEDKGMLGCFLLLQEMVGEPVYHANK